MAYQIKRLGSVPDIPDHRDFLYAAPSHVLKNFPEKIDLQPQCPKQIYDQGHLGSCTANAIAAAIEFDEIKQNRLLRHPHACSSTITSGKWNIPSP